MIKCGGMFCSKVCFTCASHLNWEYKVSKQYCWNIVLCLNDIPGFCTSMDFACSFLGFMLAFGKAHLWYLKDKAFRCLCHFMLHLEFCYFH